MKTETTTTDTNTMKGDPTAAPIGRSGAKRCDACGIEFTGAPTRCPLCQGDLRGTGTPSVFPPQRTYLKPRRMAVRILTFVVCATLLLLAFFGYLFSWPLPILLASAGATIVGLLFVNSAILHAPRPLRLMFRYCYIMLVIALIWFAATGSRIVTTFVIPIMCLASLAFDIVLLIVLRERAVTQYAKYLAFDVICGLMPLALIPLGWLTWDLLALISGLVSLLMTLGVIVFAHRTLFGELHKQFSA